MQPEFDYNNECNKYGIEMVIYFVSREIDGHCDHQLKRATVFFALVTDFVYVLSTGTHAHSYLTPSVTCTGAASLRMTYRKH